MNYPEITDELKQGIQNLRFFDFQYSDKKQMGTLTMPNDMADTFTDFAEKAGLKTVWQTKSSRFEFGRNRVMQSGERDKTRFMVIKPKFESDVALMSFQKGVTLDDVIKRNKGGYQQYDVYAMLDGYDDTLHMEPIPELSDVVSDKVNEFMSKHNSLQREISSGLLYAYSYDDCGVIRSNIPVPKHQYFVTDAVGTVHNVLADDFDIHRESEATVIADEIRFSHPDFAVNALPQHVIEREHNPNSSKRSTRAMPIGLDFGVSEQTRDDDSLSF